jgi:hypothetical protein
VRSPFPLLFEGEGCLRSRQGEVSLLVEHTASLSCPPTLTSPCFGFRQNVPLLVEGEGPEGEVCHPHFVLPNAVQPSHPHWIPRYARNDTKGMLAMTARPHPVLAFAKTSLSLLKERDQRVRFAILHLVTLSEVKHPCTG